MRWGGTNLHFSDIREKNILIGAYALSNDQLPLMYTPYNGIKTLKLYIICIYIIQDRGIK